MCVCNLIFWFCSQRCWLSTFSPIFTGTRTCPPLFTMPSAACATSHPSSELLSLTPGLENSSNIYIIFTHLWQLTYSKLGLADIISVQEGFEATLIHCDHRLIHWFEITIVMLLRMSIITALSLQDHHLPLHRLRDWSCGQVGWSHSHSGWHHCTYVSFCWCFWHLWRNAMGTKGFTK